MMHFPPKLRTSHCVIETTAPSSTIMRGLYGEYSSCMMYAPSTTPTLSPAKCHCPHSWIWSSPATRITDCFPVPYCMSPIRISPSHRYRSTTSLSSLKLVRTKIRRPCQVSMRARWSADLRHWWCGFTSLLEGKCTRMSCLSAFSFAFGPFPPRNRRTGDVSDSPHSKVASPKFRHRRVLAHAPCRLGEVPAPGSCQMAPRASTKATELQIVRIPPGPAFR
mmetsp:Transcript_53927/g.127654  ORF Transcript_53927/g.127654 Transcript_53927/m.127654 type:complete len:221 (-) Transcript_53927:94-756(-)